MYEGQSVNTNDYITCKQLIEFIGEYLDGELPADARHEFERHLNVCPSCVAYLDSYRKTIELGKQALHPCDDPASGTVPEGLVRAVREALSRLK
jgi:anti-sigma factor RsiW